MFYILFTNEFPEVLHDSSCPNKRERNLDRRTNWSINIADTCYTCGSIVIYADDSTFSTSDDDAEGVAEKISNGFSKMSDFLTSSSLKVNKDKTHSLILTTFSMRGSRNINDDVTSENITSETSKAERLLSGILKGNNCQQ